MMLGPFSTSQYWRLRSAIEVHFPHEVSLRHLRYDRAAHQEHEAWCRSRMNGGNAIYPAPGNQFHRDVMIDTDENWCYFSLVINFKDPNMAFEFKLRFA